LISGDAGITLLLLSFTSFFSRICIIEICTDEFYFSELQWCRSCFQDSTSFQLSFIRDSGSDNLVTRSFSFVSPR
jgi:hypothetical protein